MSEGVKDVENEEETNDGCRFKTWHDFNKNMS